MDYAKTCSKVDQQGAGWVSHSRSPEFMGNTEPVLMSDTTGIKVVIDRSQVLVNLGKLSWTEEEWFELSDGVHLYAPALEEVYVFPKVLHNHQDVIELQGKRLARILRQHCEPLL